MTEWGHLPSNHSRAGPVSRQLQSCEGLRWRQAMNPHNVGTGLLRRSCREGPSSLACTWRHSPPWRATRRGRGGSSSSNCVSLHARDSDGLPSASSRPPSLGHAASIFRVTQNETSQANGRVPSRSQAGPGPDSCAARAGWRFCLDIIYAVVQEEGRNLSNAASLVTGGSDTNHPLVKQWSDAQIFFLAWTHLDRNDESDRPLPTDAEVLANIAIVEDVIEVRTALFFDNLHSVQDLLDEANAQEEIGET